AAEPAAATPAAGSGGAAEEALPIDVLNLSSRAWSSLRHDGIQTLGDLTRRTEQQLRAIDGVGPASLTDIRTKLADRGLALADAEAGTSSAAADANGDRGVVGRHAGTDNGDLAEVTQLHPARHESSAAQQPPEREQAPVWQPPDNDAIDLLDVAGLPVLKRAVPAAAAVIAVLLVLFGLRRRRSRRN
ncbi:MAG: DNA-directed RNA polymerase subunit alpha C-terminal domain-containing protein, partial [Streptosporangiaceae bacterium]